MTPKAVFSLSPRRDPTIPETNDFCFPALWFGSLQDLRAHSHTNPQVIPSQLQSCMLLICTGYAD